MHSLAKTTHGMLERGSATSSPTHLSTRSRHSTSRWCHGYSARTSASRTGQLTSSAVAPCSRALTTPALRTQTEEVSRGVHTQNMLAEEHENQRPAWRRKTEMDTDSEYLFAYGSFMFPDCLLKRGVRVQYRDAAVIKDPNIKMVFKHKGGHATIERLPPGTSPRFPPLVATYGPTLSPPRVHGVLYQLHKGDLQKVQSHARNDGYVLTPIEVETYDGSVRVTAQALVSGPLSHLLGAEVVPPEMYMRMLREGAADNFLDPIYQAWLSGIDTVPSTGLPPQYFSTPSRYISATFFVMSLLLVGSTLSSYL